MISPLLSQNTIPLRIDPKTSRESLMASPALQVSALRKSEISFFWGVNDLPSKVKMPLFAVQIQKTPCSLGTIARTLTEPNISLLLIKRKSEPSNQKSPRPRDCTINFSPALNIKSMDEGLLTGITPVGSNL